LSTFGGASGSQAAKIASWVLEVRNEIPGKEFEGQDIFETKMEEYCSTHKIDYDLQVWKYVEKAFIANQLKFIIK
jgi:hypothetical protein